MNITKDISPLTEFKRDSARLIAQIKETGRPQILTVNGKPSVVVMDAAAWQDMQDQLDYAETVAGIRKGLSQALAGQGTEAGQFFDELSQRKCDFDLPIRRALYGKSTRWRIYFTVINDVVQVLHVRHGRRSDWQP
jgi:prevent-host-death family protein